jgi:hypothetical protein
MLSAMVRDLAVVSSLILCAEWLAPLLPAGGARLAGRLITVLVLAWVALSIRRVPLRQLGVRVDNLLGSLGVMAAPLLIAFGGSAVLAPGGPLLLPAPAELLRYFPWALGQQLVAVGIFWRHLRPPGEDRRLRSRANWKAAALTALSFALLHAPNPGLMLLTMAGELTWLVLYPRWPNLFALSLAHALGALLADAWWAGSSLLPHLRVGTAFWDR